MIFKNNSSKDSQYSLNKPTPEQRGGKRRLQQKKETAHRVSPGSGNVRGQSESSAVQRISGKESALKTDALWLLMFILSVYVLLCLAGFSMKDPSWSRGIPNLGQTINFGGLVGAYLSDVLYYLFGLSAFWLPVWGAVWLFRNFRFLRDESAKPYVMPVGLMGLTIVLLCTSALEKLALYSLLENRFPAGAGGWIGGAVSGAALYFLGNGVGVLLLLVFFLLGLSLLLQISLLDLLEGLGSLLERLFDRLFGDQDKMMQPEWFADAKTAVKRKTAVKAQHIVAEPVHKPLSSSSNRKKGKKNACASQNHSVQAAELQQQQTGGYRLPAASLLRLPEGDVEPVSAQILQETAALIESRLAEFGIRVQVVGATTGPVLTRYEIEPAKGVKGSQIVNLSKDLARSLMVQSVRVVETIAGKNTMGIELPNDIRQEVLLQEIMVSDVFATAASKLTVALGKDIAGIPVVGDLAKMPHLLVGGMTGSGKSVGVNAMILSILYKAAPDEVRFIMIDPKMLELSVYEGIAHLLCPVVTDMREAGNALNWCVAEMEKRYRLLSHMGVRNLSGYNEKIQAAKAEGKNIPNPFSLNPDEPEPLEKLPQIVVVIDELADLMMTERKTVETQIARLAQKARAAGIHMIIATQRPSVDVITGLIKANIPTRIAFTVQSKIDSRTILDQMGAEDLLKYGDLLFMPPGVAEPVRLQGAFVSDEEVHNVVAFVKEQAAPNYVEGILTGEAAQETNKFIHPAAAGQNADELFDQAVQFVVSSRKTSISALQRHLRIGYNRAANLMQALEEGGIVSPPDSSGVRKIFAVEP